MPKFTYPRVRVFRLLCILCLISGALCFLATAVIDFTAWDAPLSAEMFSKLGAALMLVALFFYMVNSAHSHDVAQKLMSEGPKGVGVVLSPPGYSVDANADDWWVELHMAVYPDSEARSDTAPLFESRTKQRITNAGKDYFKVGMRFPVRFDHKEKVALITTAPALPSFYRF